MNYNELAKRVHENAVKHGFWDEEYSIEHYLMLVITEIGEMVQADRKGARARTHMDDETKLRLENSKGLHFQKFFRIRVKDTLEDEYADVAIRLLDLAGKEEWDMDDALSISRDYDARNKEQMYIPDLSFTEHAFVICNLLTTTGLSTITIVTIALQYIEEWAKHLNIDLEWHIEQKMRYNETRPVRHGKRY